MPNNQDKQRPEDHINSNSRPSDLKITDLRTATVGWDGWRFTIIRIDTNQGLMGPAKLMHSCSNDFYWEKILVMWTNCSAKSNSLDIMPGKGVGFVPWRWP